jgi:PhnB protein
MPLTILTRRTRGGSCPTPRPGQPKFQGFALTVNAKDEGDADRLFTALGEGGEVRMPLAKTFFSPRFGMVADKFGVDWMVIVPPQEGTA